MEIKILGTGCPKCRALEANAREALAELGLEAAVTKVTDINRFVDYDVMTTPALVIDEEVVAAGRVATKEEIKEWLSGRK